MKNFLNLSKIIRPVIRMNENKQNIPDVKNVNMNDVCNRMLEKLNFDNKYHFISQ